MATENSNREKEDECRKTEKCIGLKMNKVEGKKKVKHLNFSTGKELIQHFFQTQLNISESIKGLRKKNTSANVETFFYMNH